jgi:hypothetical protein
MSTAYENAIDTVRETSGRLARDLPTSLPSGIMPSGVEWPDDLADRVAGELVHGFDALKGVVVPAATVAVGAGSNAAISGGRAAMSGGRAAMKHPALLVGGGLALFAVIVWLVRRRRSASDDQQAHGVESKGRPISAA